MTLELEQHEFTLQYEVIIITATTGNYYATIQFLCRNQQELTLHPSLISMALVGYEFNLGETYSAAYRLDFPTFTNHLFMYHVQFTPTICRKC
jgi:hypothetical protein